MQQIAPLARMKGDVIRSTIGGPMNRNFERIYAVVRKIPKGRVATYGQVARLAGLPRHARHVGFALAALDERAAVPWQRVVNAAGRISRRDHPNSEQRQR